MNEQQEAQEKDFYPEPLFDDEMICSTIEKVDAVILAWLKAHDAPPEIWELVVSRWLLEITQIRGPEAWPVELPRQYDIEVSSFISRIADNLVRLVVPPLFPPVPSDQSEVLTVIRKVIAGEVSPGETITTATGEVVTVCENEFSVSWPDGVVDVWDRVPENAQQEA